jgi:hypothetical protein
LELEARQQIRIANRRKSTVTKLRLRFPRARSDGSAHPLALSSRIFEAVWRQPEPVVEERDIR